MASAAGPGVVGPLDGCRVDSRFAATRSPQTMRLGGLSSTAQREAPICVWTNRFCARLSIVERDISIGVLNETVYLVIEGIDCRSIGYEKRDSAHYDKRCGDGEKLQKKLTPKEISLRPRPHKNHCFGNNQLSKNTQIENIKFAGLIKTITFPTSLYLK